MTKEFPHTGADRICLDVFGILAASVTHEIKNTLSIINENAGLLEDLCSMADEKTGVPPERVGAATTAITKQVARSNTIMKNLNRFAHSGDTIPGHAGLDEILGLMVELTSRFAAMRKVSVEISCESGVEIQTNLRVLMSLLCLVLRRLYTVCPENSALKIRGEMREERQVILRLFKEDGTALSVSVFPDPDEHALADQIGATCSIHQGALVIELAASTT